MIGLQNMTSNCFINVIIQVLLHMDKLNSALYSSTGSIDETTCEAGVLKEWKLLHDRMLDEPKSFYPREFIASVFKCAGEKGITTFTENSQNDATEFLMFVMETLHEAISGPSVMVGTRPTDSIDGQVWDLVKTQYSKKYSEILNIFYGITINEIRSTEPHHRLRSSKPEHFLVTNLFIPMIEKPSLYDCLDETFNDEIMEGDNEWFNDVTNKKEPVVTSYKIYSFPEILIFTLNRYSVRDKHTLVDIPTSVNMNSYSYKTNKKIFTLFAICNHYGNDNNSGHYDIFIKKGNRWVCFDDDSVYSVKSSSVISNNTYCLFYQ